MKNPGKVLAAVVLLLAIGFSSVHGQWRALDPGNDFHNQEGRFNVWTTHCFSREARSKAPELLGVRIGKHNGFDRIVFDLKGELEGYTVKYETKPISWYGDGETIKVKGKEFVEITFYPLSASQDQIEAYQRGVMVTPKQKKPNLPLIKEIKPLGWFEAEVAYVIGLNRRTPFRVQLLANPDRLVVDFKH
jgi:hypothetical protein